MGGTGLNTYDGGGNARKPRIIYRCDGGLKRNMFRLEGTMRSGGHELRGG